MAQPDPAGPVDIVRRYLTAMEARDLEGARGYLGDGFVMNFPGGPGMRTLEELIDRSTPRYRFVHKTYDAFEVLDGDRGPIVYVRGMLHGEWPDGEAFHDVRFIDRFEISAGQLVRQDVWNDLGEVRRGG